MPPKDLLATDPLAALAEALAPELEAVGATTEIVYSGKDRGSLSVMRDGKALQTSYFASFEVQALRDGGNAAIQNHKAIVMEQIHRLLNPPKPAPVSLTGLAPMRRSRSKKAATTEEGGTAEANSEGTDTELAADDAEPAEGMKVPAAGGSDGAAPEDAEAAGSVPAQFIAPEHDEEAVAAPEPVEV